jgi:hypothetical protein
MTNSPAAQSIMPHNPTHPKAVLIKTAMDQLLMAPVGTALFLAAMRVLEGRPGAVMDTLRAKWVAWAQAARLLLCQWQATSRGGGTLEAAPAAAGYDSAAALPRLPAPTAQQKALHHRTRWPASPPPTPLPQPLFPASSPT